MTPVLIAAGIAGLLALLVVGVRALNRAEQRVDQIFHDELDDHDPFNQNLIPRNHKPTTEELS